MFLSWGKREIPTLNRTELYEFDKIFEVATWTVYMRINLKKRINILDI